MQRREPQAYPSLEVDPAPARPVALGGVSSEQKSASSDTNGRLWSAPSPTIAFRATSAAWPACCGVWCQSYAVLRALVVRMAEVGEEALAQGGEPTLPVRWPCARPLLPSVVFEFRLDPA